MGPTGCPETSERNYRWSLSNNSEERSSQLLAGGSLKSLIVLSVWRSSVICSCGKRRYGQIHAPATLTMLPFGQGFGWIPQPVSRRDVATLTYSVAGVELLSSLQIQQPCRL